MSIAELGGKVDLLDPDLYAGDPEPTYRWLRDQAPAYWDEANRLWGISRHRDVMAVERNTRRYSSASGSRPHIDMTDSMINKDDPRHLQQRRLVSDRFTPRAVRRHEERIRAIVNGLIDNIVEVGEAEVVEDLAAPLPAMVIADLLGFDHDRWPDCKRWSEVTMGAAGYATDDPRRPDGSIDAVMEFAAAAMELVAARRAEPADDLVSVWVHARVDDQPLDDGEIVQEALLLLDGGAETTRSVIGQTVLALATHPAQRGALLEDPSLLRTTAVEEFIRWATPILNMRRTVTEEHELHGQRLRPGDHVLLLYAAANRDERVFTDPERFDVTRTHNQHVAFGFGSHFCLGANLARLELRVMFEELLRRIPDFELADGSQPRFVPGFFTRTLERLPILFTPGRGGAA
ncbi:MAG TPA: cytochrome P450 [Acidimicrobiales bacterium]|nr:cytochrome P450 [Acidimicrobiales bacterium]